MTRQVQRTTVRSAGGGQQVPAIAARDKLRVILDDLVEFKQIAPEEISGERVSLKAPQDILRVLERFRQMEGAPWETFGDQARDALYFYAVALIEMEKNNDPRLVSHLHHYRIQAEAEWLERQSQRITTATHTLRDYMLQLLSKGRYQAAHRTLMRHWREIDSIPDQDWRQDYIDATKDSPTLLMAVKVLAKLGYTIPQEMKDALR